MEGRRRGDDDTDRLSRRGRGGGDLELPMPSLTSQEKHSKSSFYAVKRVCVKSLR